MTALGFDETFVRMWHFYLDYSRPASRSGYLDVNQIVLDRGAGGMSAGAGLTPYDRGGRGARRSPPRPHRSSAATCRCGSGRGTAPRPGPTTRRWWSLRSPDALRRLLWHPGELGAAQAYVTGELDVHGDLEAALATPSPSAGSVA